MKTFKNLRAKITDFLEPTPVVKEECIVKTLYLLRRDFPIEVQNEIMISIIARLNEMRDKDNLEMERELEKRKGYTESFKARFV